MPTSCHSVCEIGAPIALDCNNDCGQYVIDGEKYCGQVAWDMMCLQLAEIWCGITCPYITPLPPEGYWLPLGCFIDNAFPRTFINRLYNTDMQTYDNWKIENCLAAAQQNGFMFAGLSDGGQCWADITFRNTSKSEASADECDSQCSANSDETCGGSWRLSAFYFVKGPRIPTISTVSAPSPAESATPIYGTDGSSNSLISEPPSSGIFMGESTHLITEAGSEVTSYPDSPSFNTYSYSYFSKFFHQFSSKFTDWGDNSNSNNHLNAVNFCFDLINYIYLKRYLSFGVNEQSNKFYEYCHDSDQFLRFTNLINNYLDAISKHK
ncbi:hypothetical protein HDU76_011008 [Blyttiomyces sp. JEL0837]|nr:hypothetical protein HDU76_011008 [Blyttiomyces sp. JEL0837]